jgi:hypothetical protein
VTSQPQRKQNATKNIAEGHEIHTFVCDWVVPPVTLLEWIALGHGCGDCRTAYVLTVDLNRGNDVQERAAYHGFDDVQILFPRDPWPIRGRWLAIFLDELMLNARGRREYLAYLKSQPPQMPTVVLSYDFHLEPPTVVRPSLMLSAQLDDIAFRALRDGYVSLPPEEKEGREAA